MGGMFADHKFNSSKGGGGIADPRGFMGIWDYLMAL
jgi:hypothetical protein